jgi:hypothetical protein
VVVENAYGDSVAHMFLVAAPLALIALVAILFLREVPLRDTIDIEETAPVPDDAPARATYASLVEGTVRDDDRPAAGAVLTLIDRSGRQLASGTTDDDGRYRLPVTGTGVPYLLVAQWRGSPHVELLGGTTGVQHRDVRIVRAGTTRRRALGADDAATEVLPAVSR